MPLTLNRRTLLALALSLPAVPPHMVSAQTPVAEAAIDQLALFHADRDALLELGRKVVAALLEPDDAAFSDAMARSELAALSASAELEWLQTNRVRLRWSDLPLVLDGHFDGSGTMMGFAWQTGGPTRFMVTADDDQAESVPTGRWTGQLGEGAAGIPLVVTFEGDADALGATLDVPDQQLVGLPASSSMFLPELPIGSMVQDSALPLGPMQLLYRSEYLWGDAFLGVDLLASPDGGILGLDVNFRASLPPDPALHLEPVSTYRLPVSGPLLVVWGGGTEFQNHHAAVPAQRHALDLQVWEHGSTCRDEGLVNEDYLIWGVEVVAPAAGTVIAVQNEQPDNLPALARNAGAEAANDGTISSPSNPAGNHVVLESAPGSYTILAHLQRGSIRCVVGDIVSPGDTLGLVGNSGSSSEPHIHIHGQNVPDLFDPAAIGLPLTFTSYQADGQEVKFGSPVQGQFVEQR